MLIDTLIRWNRWGKNKLKSGLLRDIIALLKDFILTDDIVTLTGLRRSGKTTILYQIMDLLESKGIEQKAMLHINFEEPALYPHLNLKLMDKLYDVYRAEIFPDGKAFLFLDEIQNLPEWERWVRARSETENIKIFITGSSSQLMSRELGTLLTGRHVNFEILPLNFNECLRFLNVDVPEQPWPFAAPALIQNVLNMMIRWGGLPKIVLAESDARREILLSQYFDDVLLKDIAMRHRIHDLITLRALAVYLLTQTGSLISYQRLAKKFNVSTILIQNYCSYLEEAFLLEFVPFFSLKIAERQRHPQKIHAIDPGIRNRVSLSHSIDKGRFIETLIYNRLKQLKNDGLFYWKNNGEIDLLVRESNTITKLIQVVAPDLDSESVLNREINALKEGINAFPDAKQIIITEQRSLSDSLLSNNSIRFEPLWQFLLK